MKFIDTLSRRGDESLDRYARYTEEKPETDPLRIAIRAEIKSRADAKFKAIVEQQMREHFDRIPKRLVFEGGRSMAKTKYRNTPNWVFAMEFFALGSTYAWQICLEMGIDPDAKVATARLKVAS